MDKPGSFPRVHLGVVIAIILAILIPLAPFLWLFGWGYAGVFQTNLSRSHDAELPVPIFPGARNEQARFNEFMQSHYAAGTPLAELERDLVASGFTCHRSPYSAAPAQIALSCRKHRMPYVMVSHAWIVVAHPSPDGNAVGELTTRLGATGL